jgi:hypothetical protein
MSGVFSGHPQIENGKIPEENLFFIIYVISIIKKIEIFN